MVKHLLSINDLSREEILDLLDSASEMKSELKAGGDQTHLLKNKTLGMIFEKPSLRTRVSFEVGIYQLGGRAVVLGAHEIQIGKREAISDVAKVLSGYLDIVMVRTFGHTGLEELAKHASIPIINGLSDSEHPCQILADLLTIKEEFGSFDGIQITYIGDGNNVANSLMLASSKLGIRCNIACPKGYEPNAKFYSNLTKVSSDIGSMVRGSNVIYTDVWASMGQEKEAEERKKIFKNYQINSEVLSNAETNAIVLHCLPAHREEEISGEAFAKHEATIMRQAENRLHAQKAVMLKLLQNHL